MRICCDTNVILRVLLDDDPTQADAARRLLLMADTVVLPIPVLCEAVWVLRRGYKMSNREIAAGIESIITSEKVETDQAAAEAGIRALRNGYGFADAAIATLGIEAGAAIFATFDQRAVTRLVADGYDVRTPYDLLTGRA